MRLDEIGRKFIQKEEGCILHAYKCSAGVLTIGWGHTDNVKEHDLITLDEAKAFFDADVRVFELGVTRLTASVTITQNQFNALVSFAYNLGVGALGKSSLLKLVKANGSPEAITAAFRLWNKVNGVTSQSILGRRNREAKLYYS